jgi:serine/threonine-protein kinase
MKKVPLDGGIAQTICKAAIFPTPSWGESGDILFSVTRDEGIFRVKATGGAFDKLPLDVEVDGAPQWIPGTRGFLFVGGTKSPELWAGTVDNSAPPQRLMELGSHDPSYLLSPSGVLFFNAAGVLNAQRLDAGSRQLVGTPVALGKPAGTPRAWFGAAAGPDSVLLLAGHASVAGNPGDPVSRLSWVDRQGTVVGDLAGPGRYWTVHLSPDGQRAVVNPDKDLWVVDVRTHMRTRVTTAPNAISGAIWSPDSTRLLHGESGAFWTRSADGQSKPAEIFKFTTMGFAALDWSNDATKVLISGRQAGPSGSSDLFVLTLATGTVTPLVTSDYRDIQGRLSANGRWVAYVSNASGRNEVYIRALDGNAAPVRISSDGGDHPMWRRDSRELFFLSPTDEFIAVDLSAFEGTRQPGAATKLFRMVVNDVIRDSYAPFDVAADGQRFLINVAEPAEPLTLIQGIGARLASKR